MEVGTPRGLRPLKPQARQALSTDLGCTLRYVQPWGALGRGSTKGHSSPLLLCFLASREDPMLLFSLGGSKSLSDGRDYSHICLPLECWRASRLSLDWEYRVLSGVPSEVHSLLKEIPGSGRLAASAVNHSPCSFLMYFKYSQNYQEMSFTKGSVECQSLSMPALLQQLGGGAVLLLSSATGLPEESNAHSTWNSPRKCHKRQGRKGRCGGVGESGEQKSL